MKDQKIELPKPAVVAVTDAHTRWIEVANRDYFTREQVVGIIEADRRLRVEPVKVFSDGPWLFRETGEEFSGADLDAAAFAVYRGQAAPVAQEPVTDDEYMPPLDDRAAYSAEHIRQLIRSERRRRVAPVAAKPSDLGPIRVGNLPTMNQDEYPGLGDWWVQLRIGNDGDEVLARVYGDTPEQARQRAVALAAHSAPQAAEKPAPCAHIFEARPINGVRSASGPFAAVCRECGYRPSGAQQDTQPTPEEEEAWQAKERECMGDPEKRTGIYDPQVQISVQASRLVDEAIKAGMVVRIDLVPRQPLAMGNLEMVVDVRPARRQS